MLALLTTVAVAAANTTLPPRQVTLGTVARYALISGLRYRLGGRFIIHNLQNAAATCEIAGACSTTREVIGEAQTNSRLKKAASVSDMLREARVDGHAPVALVAVRGGRSSLRSAYPELVLDVFDATSQRWTRRIAELGQISAFGVTTVKLVGWSRVDA